MRIHKLMESNTVRSRSVTWQNFLQALPRVQTALHALDQNIHVYRGLRDSDAEIRFKPQMTKGDRKSANTYNYYTLLIDHMPAWQSYPARSASLIASLDDTYARHYGDVHLMLPEGDPQVGICPAADMWDSFGHMKHLLGPGGPHNLDDFNMCIRNAQRVMLDPDNTPRVESHAELMHMLQQIHSLYHSATPTQQNELYDATQVLWTYLTKGDLYDQLQQLFDPNKNNFVLHAWHELQAYMGHDYEVWFSAPVWMINLTHAPFKTLKPTSEQILSYARSQAELGI